MADDDSGDVVVRRFLEYEDLPYVFAKGGELFRMRFSKSASRGYILEPAKRSMYADVSWKGSTISESEAKSLL